MQNKTAAHVIAIHFTDANSERAPEWIHAVPLGEFRGVDGRGPYVLDDATAVVSLFNSEGRKLPIDENHSTDLAAKSGLSAPARGWIVALETRHDGVWAKVDWTTEGNDLVATHAYGFLSPVFLHTAARPHRVQKLLRVALTNDPNLTTLTALHSKEIDMDIVALRKALGLPDTADEATVITAAATAHSASTAYSDQMSKLAGAAGVEPSLTGDALVTALQSKFAPASAALSENAELKTQLISLQTQVQEMASQHARSAAQVAIDAAISEGKLVPALREHFIARHCRNPNEVTDELKLMPSINAGGIGVRLIPSSDGLPSLEELRVASLMGVDPEAFKAQHKALHGKGL